MGKHPEFSFLLQWSIHELNDKIFFKMTLLKGMISQRREIFTCCTEAWIMGGRDTPRKEKGFLLSRIGVYISREGILKEKMVALF